MTQLPPSGLNQPSTVTHIKADARGVVGLNLDQFYTQVYAQNRGIIESDTNHSDESIRAASADTIPAKVKAGVTDIFLEIPKDSQAEIDAYMQTGNEGELKNRAVVMMKTLLVKARSEVTAGKLKVWAMDLDDDEQPASAIINARLKEFDLEKKLNSAVAFGESEKYKLILNEFNTRYAEEVSAHKIERIKANESMSAFIADKMKGRPKDAKYCVMVGLAHTDNYTDTHTKGMDNSRDMDELCAAKIPGGCVNLELRRFDIAAPVIMKPAKDKPYPYQRDEGRDVPEFSIALPDESAIQLLRHPRIKDLNTEHQYHAMKLVTTDVRDAMQKIGMKFLMPKLSEDEAANNRKKMEAGKALGEIQETIGTLDFEGAKKKIATHTKNGIFDITSDGKKLSDIVGTNIPLIVDQIDSQINAYNAQDRRTNDMPNIPPSTLPEGVKQQNEMTPPRK